MDSSAFLVPATDINIAEAQKEKKEGGKREEMEDGREREEEELYTATTRKMRWEAEKRGETQVRVREMAGVSKGEGN